MGKRKSWREKLENEKGLPRVVTIDDTMSKRWGEGTVVIPAPREVDELMQRVQKGNLTTINRIREALAKRHKATMACPITTGIFARVAAEVAAEDEADGKKDVTPFWRTLKVRGELNPKYPGSCEGQKARLESEGYTVVQKGKRFFVVGFESHVQAFDTDEGPAE